ncbi:MAG: hypothetical protein QXW79_00035 [Thermoplasmata archaeon]
MKEDQKITFEQKSYFIIHLYEDVKRLSKILWLNILKKLKV